MAYYLTTSIAGTSVGGLTMSPPPDVCAQSARDEARRLLDAHPFVVARLPNDDVAKAVAQRLVSLYSVEELWAQGPCYSRALAAMASAPSTLTGPYFGNVRAVAAALPTYCWG